MKFGQKINKARKNLGHWKEPEEIKVLEHFYVSLKTAIETSEAIFTAGVTQPEASMLYQGVFRPKVECPLGHTFLTDKQVKKIESVSMLTIIAKYGYNRNIALDIRGGPKELDWTGLYSFKNTIGATRVQNFLKNWRTPKEDIGKTLCIVMSWTQYSAEVPYPILSNTSQDLLYVKGRTILATRKHLVDCQRKIHLDTTYVQHLKHENDVSIMHLVNTQTDCKVTINQKEKINCV